MNNLFIWIENNPSSLEVLLDLNFTIFAECLQVTEQGGVFPFFDEVLMTMNMSDISLEGKVFFFFFLSFALQENAYYAVSLNKHYLLTFNNFIILIFSSNRNPDKYIYMEKNVCFRSLIYVDTFLRKLYQYDTWKQQWP